MEILRCENLTKVYGSGDTSVRALDGVTFSVEAGEFVSIVGPSGSGKSTLLHILGGVDKPADGKVWIGGTDIHSLSENRLAVFRRRQIGLIYQFYNLIPVLNVEENIVLPHLLDGRKLDRERLDQVVKSMGLEDRKYHLPKQLSGGQQQRVSIGRALEKGADDYIAKRFRIRELLARMKAIQRRTANAQSAGGSRGRDPQDIQNGGKKAICTRNVL